MILGNVQISLVFGQFLRTAPGDLLSKLLILQRKPKCFGQNEEFAVTFITYLLVEKLCRVVRYINWLWEQFIKHVPVTLWCNIGASVVFETYTLKILDYLDKKLLHNRIFWEHIDTQKQCSAKCQHHWDILQKIKEGLKSGLGGPF